MAEKRHLRIIFWKNYVNMEISRGFVKRPMEAGSFERVTYEPAS